VLSAAETLFRQGLADPRGLEYRDVEIRAGDVWSGGGAPVRTGAWVLPGTAPLFAVAWNGLVYPIVSVGAKRDLQTEVTAMVRADEALRAKWAAEHPGGGSFHRFRHAHAESEAISEKSLTAMKTLLLVRAGEPKLGRDVWEAFSAGMHADTNDDAIHIGDPYLMLASDWAWSLFDRAVCAHMRGDDPMALASARALVIIAQRIEAEAARRGFPRRSGDADEPVSPYLHFLGPLPDLLADQERRASPSSSAPADRIAGLIRDLDQVAERQWGQPGGVDLSSDPRVKALIVEGEAAVDPLLDALEHDVRLTRSVHFHRDFGTHRSILGVAEAAYVALAGILQASFFGAVSTGDDLSGRGAAGRREVAASVRAYWTKWKGIPLEERWYRVLADDASPPEQWIEAARNLTTPTNVTVHPGSMVTVLTTAGPTSGSPALRGDALRSRRHPSVTELLSRRVDDLGHGPLLTDRPALSCTLAQLLGEWDAAGGAAALARQVKRVLEALPSRPPGSSLAGSTGARCIADVTLARLRGTDRGALDEYARWIRAAKPEDVSWYTTEVFAPMWQNAGHPAVEQAATALFGDPRSPWYDLLNGSSAPLLEVPMGRLRAYRARLLEALGNRASVGTVKVRARDQVTYAGAGSQTMTGIDRSDPHAPPAGTEHPFRACDYVAWKISSQQGAPVFRPYWPEAVRDDALQVVVTYVKAQGTARKR
jgi:hypothetical protein